MRDRQEAIGDDQFIILTFHAQKNFMVNITTHTGNRLGHQEKMVVFQRLL
ncbi:Uncharacterised protein [Shigella sonnei]|nr:Uncharacterised protein [Shigella sonnei]